mgnify:CR=1 FL=1
MGLAPRGHTPWNSNTHLARKQVVFIFLTVRYGFKLLLCLWRTFVYCNSPSQSRSKSNRTSIGIARKASGGVVSGVDWRANRLADAAAKAAPPEGGAALSVPSQAAAKAALAEAEGGGGEFGRAAHAERATCDLA